MFLNVQGSPVSAEPIVLPGICNGQPTYLNTSRQGQVVIIGRPRDYRYVVAIPDFSNEILLKTRQCVVDAFITQADQGKYIQVGAFASRSQAEFLTFILRQHGLDARVVYF